MSSRVLTGLCARPAAVRGASRALVARARGRWRASSTRAGGWPWTRCRPRCCAHAGALPRSDRSPRGAPRSRPTRGGPVPASAATAAGRRRDRGQGSPARGRARRRLRDGSCRTRSAARLRSILRAVAGPSGCCGPRMRGTSPSRSDRRHGTPIAPSLAQPPKLAHRPCSGRPRVHLGDRPPRSQALRSRGRPRGCAPQTSRWGSPRRDVGSARRRPCEPQDTCCRRATGGCARQRSSSGARSRAAHGSSRPCCTTRRASAARPGRPRRS